MFWFLDWAKGANIPFKHVKTRYNVGPGYWISNKFNNTKRNNNNNNNNINFGSETMISAVTLCIQMVVDAVKEMVVRGTAMKEDDCRVLAQTCVDILSAKNQRTWNKVVSHGCVPTAHREPELQQNNIQ